MCDGGELGKIDSHLPMIDGQSACQLAISNDENRDTGDGLLITEYKDRALQSLSPFLGQPGSLSTPKCLEQSETEPVNLIRNILLVEKIVCSAK